jgi:hypothetical protein
MDLAALDLVARDERDRAARDERDRAARDEAARQQQAADLAAYQLNEQRRLAAEEAASEAAQLLADQHRLNTRGPVKNEARSHTRQILDGRFVVPRHDIGLRTPCVHCRALLWPREHKWTSICCLGGKVVFDLPPAVEDMQDGPAKTILQLWSNQGVEGRIMRTNSRPLNGALCLASLIVDTV